MTTIDERDGTRTVAPPASDTKATIPDGALLTSALGLGPIPFTQILNVTALVAEANRGQRGDDQQLTQMETVVRSRAEERAERRLHRQNRRIIEPRIRTIKAEHAEINLLDQVLTQLPTASMMGPNGEQLDPAEAVQAHRTLREQITADQRAGSRKHVVTARHVVRDIAMMALDFPVFLFAMLGLLNVRIRLIGYDFATNVMAAVAILFATLGTVLLAVVMRRMGRRHRVYKGGTGGIDSSTRTRTVTVEGVGIVITITIAATVMASRVWVEGLGTGASPILIGAMAALFAILIGFSAYINYRSEFDNGSPETDRLQHLSLEIRGRENQIHSHQNARKLKVEQAGVNTAKLNRAVTTARSTATKSVTSSIADKAIRLARSYATNPCASLPDPNLDFTRLDLAAKQAIELAEHQTYLESRPMQPDYDADLFAYLNEEM